MASVIASVRGVVLASGSGWVVVEMGGIGVRAEVTAELALTVRAGQELFLLTSLVVREDSLTLFGFASQSELELFGRLIAVSGVGPRSALGVLSTLSPALTFVTKSAAASQISAQAKVKRRISIVEPPTVLTLSTALPYIRLTVISSMLAKSRLMQSPAIPPPTATILSAET